MLPSTYFIFGNYWKYHILLLNLDFRGPFCVPHLKSLLNPGIKKKLFLLSKALKSKWFFFAVCVRKRQRKLFYTSTIFLHTHTQETLPPDMNSWGADWNTLVFSSKTSLLHNTGNRIYNAISGVCCTILNCQVPAL